MNGKNKLPVRQCLIITIYLFSNPACKRKRIEYLWLPVANDGEQDKAIDILTLNTKRFPKSANTWDSPGEAYALKGDKKCNH
ncbi:MAG: hypothetical protein JNL23_07340 [Chitinophagaceae bacterium]|nr:hypothetical protein [Chitinophagaceae bacterium]